MVKRLRETWNTYRRKTTFKKLKPRDGKQYKKLSQVLEIVKVLQQHTLVKVYYLCKCDLHI